MRVVTGSPRRIAAVDWGTSSLRAALMTSEGGMLDRIQSSSGAGSLRPDEFEGVLHALLEPWMRESGDRLAVYVCGMAGARRGWREVPYVNCPAREVDLADGVSVVRGSKIVANLIPGVMRSRTGALPDVMRGEETQLLGMGISGQGAVILPGTHSKWAVVEKGEIVDFQTFMTGDLYAALSEHTILKQFVRVDHEYVESAFARGVELARESAGDMTRILFSVRASVLLGQLAPEGSGSFLSGLLIGCELLSGDRALGAIGRYGVVGSQRLMSRYSTAGTLLGIEVNPGPEDAAFQGCFRIARLRAGWSPD